jgi:molybdopterin-guanine dinucleotide biosynthesis protein A
MSHRDSGRERPLARTPSSAREPTSWVKSMVAVVLAGGDGRRMGGLKPLRAYGRTTLIERAVSLAETYCGVVGVAVRGADQVRGIGSAELLLDPPTLAGPMAGLASALNFGRRMGASHVLTLPCDSPLLPADLKDRLAKALTNGGGGRVAVAESSGRVHPVCAVWPTNVSADLTAYTQAGRSSLKGFASDLGMTVVDWGHEPCDPFSNANTQEDLAALQPDYVGVGGRSHDAAKFAAARAEAGGEP